MLHTLLQLTTFRSQSLRVGIV